MQIAMSEPFHDGCRSGQRTVVLQLDGPALLSVESGILNPPGL